MPSPLLPARRTALRAALSVSLVFAPFSGPALAVASMSAAEPSDAVKAVAAQLAAATTKAEVIAVLNRAGLTKAEALQAITAAKAAMGVTPPSPPQAPGASSATPAAAGTGSSQANEEARKRNLGRQAAIATLREIIANSRAAIPSLTDPEKIATEERKIEIAQRKINEYMAEMEEVGTISADAPPPLPGLAPPVDEFAMAPPEPDPFQTSSEIPDIPNPVLAELNKIEGLIKSSGAADGTILSFYDTAAGEQVATGDFGQPGNTAFNQLSFGATTTVVYVS